MNDISILYDRSETDELGIKKTAEEMGIKLGYLPFYKIAVGFDSDELKYSSLGRDYTRELIETKVVLNRTQSKSRRIYATTIMEATGKYVLNPLNIELNCQSKLRTLLTLRKNGIKIPKTVYVPSNPRESTGTAVDHDNSEVIGKLIKSHLETDFIVLKPDAGTHGTGVTMVQNYNELSSKISKIKPSLINPSGVVAQELIPKWFFDLRIITFKKRNERAICHENALVRAGFKDFRTNTFLGNMVFRVKLPEKTRNDAVKCGDLIAGKSEAWVIALDAMPNIGEDRIIDDNEIIKYFSILEKPFELVKRVKSDENKKRDFGSYTKNIDSAYSQYMSTDAYSFIQEIIQESLEKARNNVVFHEGNSCPEFWEQTRIVAGINVAEYLLEVAESVINCDGLL